MSTILWTKRRDPLIGNLPLRFQKLSEINFVLKGVPQRRSGTRERIRLLPARMCQICFAVSFGAFWSLKHMARRPLTFKQHDVERAIRAAQAAKLPIGRVEIDKAGKIVVVPADQEAAPKEKWVVP